MIKDYNYDAIQFYGIILIYLNCYDYDSFLKYFDKLYKEKANILFDILIIYFSHFLNPIKQNLLFFIKFIDFTISNKEFFIFENILNVFMDLEICIYIIEKLKEKIYNKYVNSNKNVFKPFKLKGKLKTKDKIKEMDKFIIPSLESIIKFSKEKKVLLLYLDSDLWEYFLNYYNVPNKENIYICYKLREIFIKYNTLINDLFKDDKHSDIKKDIARYFQRDIFAFTLDNNIKNIFNDKKLSNSEILQYIFEYNPYYKEDNLFYLANADILDYINFETINNEFEDYIFIDKFKELKFESIFKHNITEFLYKMISKINNISTFGIILELIDIKSIPENIDKFFFKLMKIKYENVIKKEKQLNETIKIVVKFIDLIFIHERNCNFIEKAIDKLDKKIIYSELLKRCKGEQYNIMKEFIYQKFLNDSFNVNNIIYLINNLSSDDKDNLLRDLLSELMKKNKFTKEEFYSNNKNAKIDFIYELYGKGLIKYVKNFYLEDILGEIRFDIEQINKRNLEEFLENKKEEVIKRLSLLRIILNDFNPEEKHIELRKKLEEIKMDIKELTYIKNNLIIYFPFKYKEYINQIKDKINRFEDVNIKDYKSIEIRDSLQIEKFKSIADTINKVKDFLLFKVIYENANGNDEEKRFDEALKYLAQIKLSFKRNVSENEIYTNNQEIFEKIKILLNYNENKIDVFIEEMINYFEISISNRELIDNLIIIFKSQKYEMDLKSLIFFFESFQKDDKYWNDKISKENERLSEMGLYELKKKLIQLKKDHIYDYQAKNKFLKFFISFYEKKEAIDFLLSIREENIYNLYDKITPTNRIITIKSIDDTRNCLYIFNNCKRIIDNNKILQYIKYLDDEKIIKFESYSKIYSLIIELDRNNDFLFILYEKVYDIIKNAIFIFERYNYNFYYSKEDKEEFQINMEE